MSAATRGSSAEPAAKAALGSTSVMLKSIAVRSKSVLIPWIKRKDGSCRPEMPDFVTKAEGR